MVYFSIISALPTNWKSYMRENADNLVYTVNPSELRLSFFNTHVTLNRAVYSSIVQDHNEIPTCVSKWNNEFSCNLDWSKIFTLPHKAVYNTKLRYFQFSFIHRILHCNSFLYKIGVLDSPLCTFCNNAEESISHLFWDCPIISAFWRDAVHVSINVPVCLTKELIFFGNLDCFKSPINYFIINAKKFIYTCRIRKSPPQIIHFHRTLSFNLNVLKHLSNNKYDRDHFSEFFK